jgi:hypothetical protein
VNHFLQEQRHFPAITAAEQRKSSTKARLSGMSFPGARGCAQNADASTFLFIHTVKERRRMRGDKNKRRTYISRWVKLPLTVPPAVLTAPNKEKGRAAARPIWCFSAC